MGREEKRNLSDKAYEQIKNMILHLDIKPGERIPEEKIARFIDGSRTPVREAMRRLSAEGLVNIYPRRYAQVACFDEEAVRQIGTVRLSQDLLSCSLAIQYGTPEQFAQLESLAKQCEFGAKSGNIYNRIAYDSAFHLGIAQIGGNDLLIQNQKKTYLLVHLIQISKYTGVEDSLKQISHHKEIVDSLCARDYSRACRTVIAHLKDYFKIDPAVAGTMLSF